MAGTFRGFRSRAQLGLRAPRSVSRNISPGGANGGVTVHYGGPRVGITAATPHSACERRFRAWQDFHMGSQRGWADIAYTGGFCQHGYAFAGRGVGRRTAGQGTNTGNLKSYAIVFIGGEGDMPTPDAVAAMAWWIDTLRKAGAGPRVWGHWEWKPTSCPGKYLFAEAKKFDRKPVGGVKSVAQAKADRKLRMPLVEDGAMGSQTRMAFETYVDPSRVDGEWDRLDIRRLQSWAGRERTGVLDRDTTRAVQTKLGLNRTGLWDKGTTAAFQQFLNRRFADGSLKP